MFVYLRDLENVRYKKIVWFVYQMDTAVKIAVNRNWKLLAKDLVLLPIIRGKTSEYSV